MTPTQRKNLTRLRDFLADPESPPNLHPEQFSMTYYFDSPDIEELDDYAPAALYRTADPVNHCGTVACAVGWAPAAGVKLRKKDECWSSYCDRVFGFDDFSNAFDWMFNGNWRWKDNTPQGAAKRITYFLNWGAPYDGALWLGPDHPKYQELPLK